MTMPAVNYDTDPVSAELRAQYEANDVVALWESDNGAIKPPGEKSVVWPWATMRPMMIETAKITLPAIIERRVMQMVNRTNTVTSTDATSGLINAAMQALMPGEHARPHRHSMDALRFILEGAGAETIVNGKICRMEPGDLVTTPAWTWHEHHNVGGAPTIWIDILDAALHRALGTAAFEPGPIQGAATETPDAAFASAAFLPVLTETTSSEHSPLFRYPMSQARSAVAAAPPAPDGSRTVRYVNPINGGPVVQTIDCYLKKIAAGSTTAAARSSASGLCIVVDGEGSTTCGSETVTWRPNDVFTLPQATWISHRCESGSAHLFIATNREIFRRLGLLVEETNPSDG